MASLLEYLGALSTPLGAVAGAAGNIAATAMQNRQQEYFFNQYMSPQARMAQMKAAGINPNAAAQGISGAAAPQMNAAAPTNAFTGIGEQLGNSANSFLQVKNLIAEEKKTNEEARGQEIQNKILETEAEKRPEYLDAQINDLKSSADEKRQNIDNLKKQIEQADAEIKKLKAEESFITAQEGSIQYENALRQAETRRADAEAALKKSEKELTDVEREIQEKERDNYLTPEERIKMPIETEYNVDPIRADFTDIHNSKKTLEAILDQYESNQKEIYRKYDAGEISDKEYLDLMKENDMLARQTRVSLRDVNKAFDNLSYKNGYHSWWQDNATSLIDSAAHLSGLIGAAGVASKRVPIFRPKK